tara:strand:+ start:92 stop:460 length:369 start_codon:yes stop_codon:yes gene_type:complete
LAQLARIKFIKETENGQNHIRPEINNTSSGLSMASGAIDELKLEDEEVLDTMSNASAKSRLVRSQDAGFYIMSGKHRNEEWYTEIESACAEVSERSEASKQHQNEAELSPNHLNLLGGRGAI